MINQKKTKQILWYESLGFLGLIALSWLNELVSLPHLVFGTGEHSSLHEATLETLALVAVWLVVMLLTKRLMKRLFYLDEFLRVCSWCRKVGHDEKWSTVEDYFATGFDIHSSHGMCPECQEKWVRSAKKNVA